MLVEFVGGPGRGLPPCSDYGDFVDKTDFGDFPDWFLMFTLLTMNPISIDHVSGPDLTYNVAHQQQDAKQIRPSNGFNPRMQVFRMQTVILQTIANERVC